MSSSSNNSPGETILEMASALEAAGRAVLKIRKSGALGTRDKVAAWDVVTEGDKASERILTRTIAARFPEDGITGEEGTTRPSRNGRTWYLDPIDGTTNYAAGNPMFGISAGCFVHYTHDLGLVHFPALPGRPTYAAARGTGARILGKDAQLIAPPFDGPLSSALVGGAFNMDMVHLFAPVRAKVRNLVAYGSVVYEAICVAEGRTAAFFHTGATIFDVAAVATIVAEAGGYVGGILEESVDYTAKRIPIIFARDRELAVDLRMVLRDNWTPPTR